MLLSKLGSAVALMGAASAQKVKFMPLGDSITEITCWRGYVWDMLGDAGMLPEADFVGSSTNDKGDCVPEYQPFDFDHEGHSSWLGTTIAEKHLKGWLAAKKPDVVNVMLGTNDIFYDHSTDAIINAYSTMVNLMRESNPNMQIIFDTLFPFGHDNAAVKALNSRIPAWAKSLNTTASPIYVADCSEQNGATMDMLRDGTHPNDAGDRFMAEQVGPLLLHSIKQVIAGRNQTSL